ncbi:DUF6461 domain-containing protein [Actinomadura sp. WMMB 499]|uniref:DUF6461 domain-containing protein n=1 Tax=Actinomadura sp. WMMB 499 TaxID=1219491 RepID=UPI0012457A7A|nr:DUF6461 domain-containing protein [Actinomadura sp. WMMB 499]QFG24279.1 hypothetical protein F7P10_27265 [Actinomadura sp. WMMB 499]
MATTATDYRWINDYPGLTEAYCVTLVRGVSVQQFLQGMRAEPEESIPGYSAFEDRTWEVWGEHDGDHYLIGATSVPGDEGEWVLGLEVNGFLGTVNQLVAPLSHDTRLVSHFCNVNAVDRFLWYDDGTLRTSFEPLFPTQRATPDPDGLVGLMEEVGFDLREGDEHDFSMLTEAAFALAERLTGVRVTPDVLDDATFATGLVPWSAVRNS